MIMADHGIRPHAGTTEADAMLAIGKHLHRCGLPVPEIYYADTFSGMIFLQDLGDEHLQQAFREASAAAGIDMYRRVIRVLMRMAVEGKKGFDTTWTCQTAYYDKNLILEKECRYFVEAFLQGYLNIDTDMAEFGPDFEHLADQALRCGHPGFMHRDFQSRNIMIGNGRVHLIDFQGGRLGPVQYDLASLLIDPYVQLTPDVQQQLLVYAVGRLKALEPLDADRFITGYRYCRLTRSLQILGAFAFLSRVKGKSEFEAHITPALRTLARLLESDEGRALPRLQKKVRRISRAFFQNV
jgi:aminoglycoside/choline kinase family phosphotransferase